MAEDFEAAEAKLVFVRLKGERLERSWLGEAMAARGYEPLRVFGPYTLFVPATDAGAVSPSSDGS